MTARRRQRVAESSSVLAVPESELFGLFPTPVRRLRGVLEARLVAGLVDRFTTSAQQQNSQSMRPSRTSWSSESSYSGNA